MNKKINLILTCLMALMVLLLYACSPDGAPLVPLVTNTLAARTKTSTPTPAAELPRIKIEPDTLAGIQVQVAYAFVGQSASQFSDLVAKFNTLNEWGIIVYPHSNDSNNSLYAMVSSSLESPNQPDLVITLPEQVLDWDAKGAVIDLADYQKDPRYGFSAEDVSDFKPIFWDLAGQNEKTLGLPAQLSASYLYYNQTWARELGFTKIPLTSSDFRKQACAANQSFRTDSILQNDGYGGWIVYTSPESMLAWMQAFGGGVFKDGQIIFSNDGNQTALEFLKKLYEDNCAFISTEPNQYPSFANRSALFITADLAELPLQSLAFEQAGNPDEWTLIPFPGQKRQLIAEGPVLTVLKSTPEKQLAAWLFTRWFLSNENQVSWVKATGMLPLRTSTYEALSAYRSIHPQWNDAVASMDLLSTQPNTDTWRKARPVLGDATNYMFRNNLSLDQIPDLLTRMDETVQELIEAKP